MSLFVIGDSFQTAELKNDRQLLSDQLLGVTVAAPDEKGKKKKQPKSKEVAAQPPDQTATTTSSINLAACYYGASYPSDNAGRLITAPERRELLLALSAVFQKEEALPFRFPFDVQSLPSYSTTVPNPCDLCLLGSQILATTTVTRSEGGPLTSASNVTIQEGSGTSSDTPSFHPFVCQFQDTLVDVFLNSCMYHQVGSQLCGGGIRMLQLMGAEFEEVAFPFYHTYLLGSGGSSGSGSGVPAAGLDAAHHRVLQMLMLSTISELRALDGKTINAQPKWREGLNASFLSTGVEALIEGVPSNLDQLLQLVLQSSASTMPSTQGASSSSYYASRSTKILFPDYASFHRMLDMMIASAIASNAPGTTSRTAALRLRAQLPSLIESIFASTAATLTGSNKSILSKVQVEGLDSLRLHRRVDPWIEERRRPNSTTSPTSSTSAVAATPSCLTSEEGAKLMNVLLSLQSLDTTAAFTYPVLAKDYLALIPQPMDFTTIKYKLMKSKYHTPKEVLDDVELIYDNCLTFNGPGHPLTREIATIRSKLPDLLAEFEVGV